MEKMWAKKNCRSSPQFQAPAAPGVAAKEEVRMEGVLTGFSPDSASAWRAPTTMAA